MIYVCEFDGLLSDGRLRNFAAQLHPEWSRQSQDAKRWPHLRERILAYLLLQYAARREYGIRELAELELCRTKEGKPYSAACPELFFNLSHCETACACILAKQNVGIDVERRFAFRPLIAKRACTQEEKNILESLTELRREQVLQLLWSMKESFVKLDGRGLAYGMHRVDLTDFLKADWQETGGAEENRAWRSRAQLPSLKSRNETVLQLSYLVQQTGTYTLAACASQLPDGLAQVKERELAE